MECIAARILDASVDKATKCDINPSIRGSWKVDCSSLFNVHILQLSSPARRPNLPSRSFSGYVGANEQTLWHEAVHWFAAKANKWLWLKPLHIFWISAFATTSVKYSFMKCRHQITRMSVRAGIVIRLVCIDRNNSACKIELQLFTNSDRKDFYKNKNVYYSSTKLVSCLQFYNSDKDIPAFFKSENCTNITQKWCFCLRHIPTYPRNVHERQP